MIAVRCVAALLLALLALPAACSSDDVAGYAPSQTSSSSSGDAGPGTSSGFAADGSTAVDGSTVNPNPTVSAYVGVNLSADLWAADFGNQLNAFIGNVGANGLPADGQTGTSSTDAGFLFPNGAYTLVYEGTGAVTVGGIGTLHDVTAEGNVHRGIVDLVSNPGQFGQMLTITIANAAGQSITALHLYPPGVDPAATFYPAFLNALTPFRALRFMDWEATNGSTMERWNQRPTSTRFGAQDGVPYELIVELLNQTGKDGWLTVPEKVDDDFVAQFAQFFATKLDFERIQNARNAAGFSTPFRLYVENSNETWNTGFSAYGTFLAAANADAARYPGTTRDQYGPEFMRDNASLMKVGQYSADRLVKIGNAFKAAFTTIGKADAIAPVLAGWALGPAYSDVGLQFIATNYGDPKAYVAGVAQAPYFSLSRDDAAAALPSLFDDLNAEVAAKDATYAEFARLGGEYGIPIVAYEGGQGMDGPNHLHEKHLAQHDARMYVAYTAYLALWKKHFGTDLFMQFNLAGSPGIPESYFQYGYWGSLEGIRADLGKCGANLPTLTGNEPVASVVAFCPKYRALAEQVPGF